MFGLKYQGKRVLVFNPYVPFPAYVMWDTSIMHAAREHGAETRYLVCDGILPECACWRPAFAQYRQELSCGACQSRTLLHLRDLRVPPTFLGHYVTRDERHQVQAWVDGLRKDELMEARYQGRPLGQWLRSSLNTHFRIAHLDIDDPPIEAAYRGYLVSGAVAWIALSNYFDEFRPDVLVLYNGRLDVTRVALEIALERGVRALVHEGGYINDAMAVWADESCASVANYLRSWEEWKAIPLSASQLSRVEEHLKGRANGTEVWQCFSKTSQSRQELLDHLELSGGRPIWAIYTSSEDELVASEGWTSPFEHQLHWLIDTIKYAAKRPQVDFVIRVHPNTGGKHAVGNNQAQLEEFKALKERLPANMRMVMPEDPVDTYQLMDVATVGLVFQSTVAVEMAARGKQVVLGCESAYHPCPAFTRVIEREAYTETLDRFLDLPIGKTSPEIARWAFRYAYHLFFGQTVPFEGWLSIVHDNGEGKWESRTHPDQFLPGANPHIARLMRIMFEREPVYPPPTALDFFRSPAAEEAHFGLLLSTPRFPLDVTKPRTVLHHSTWDEGRWREVIRTFQSSPELRRDVALVLWADPSQGISLEALQSLILKELDSGGLPEAEWPEILLVPDRLELVDLGALYESVDVVVPAGDPFCESLARARGVSSCALDRLERHFEESFKVSS